MTESKILSSLPKEEAKNYVPSNNEFELTPEEIEEIKQRRLQQSVKVTEGMEPIKEIDDFYNQLNVSNENFDPFEILDEEKEIKKETKKSTSTKKNSKKTKMDTKKEENSNIEATFKTLDNEIESTKKHAIDAMLNTSKEYEEDTVNKVFIDDTPTMEKVVDSEDLDKNKVFDVQPKQEVKTKVETPVNVLSNFKVDLEHIEITDTADAMADAKNLETIFNNKATYEVTAFQSGYNAEMSALTLQDISSLMGSTNDVLTNRKKLYREIYSHIENTSVGKMSYSDWTKITAFGDIETLLYGIYCQTFPTKNEFAIPCPSCGKSTSFVINNISLIGVADQELMTHRVNEVRKTATSMKDLVNNSLVHIEHRIILPDTKTIVTLKLPSASDYLDLLTRIDQKFLIENYEAVGTLLYVKNIYVPNIKETVRTGSPKFNLIEDRNSLINIIMKLSVNDGIYLGKEINTLGSKYTVEYRINGVKCNHCKEPIPSTPVDIEKILFTAMDRLKEA